MGVCKTGGKTQRTQVSGVKTARQREGFLPSLAYELEIRAFEREARGEGSMLPDGEDIFHSQRFRRCSREISINPEQPRVLLLGLLQ
jgi:hypothetical protein